jgi:hypothetical protein
MTRFVSVLLSAVLGAGLFACGSNGSSGGGVEDLFPKDNTVSGWTVDQSDTNIAKGKPAAVATTKQQATDDFSLDGAVEPFYAPGFTPVKFAMQAYVNSGMSATAQLYIVQMPDADQAEKLYASLPPNSLYSSNVWEDPSGTLVGTNSRITDTGVTWWINFYKGIYYAQLKVKPSSGGDTTKNETYKFAQAVAAKM